MPIAKKPARPVEAPKGASLDAFIDGAPDAKTQPAAAAVGRPKGSSDRLVGRKKPVTFTVAPALLEAFDQYADSHGLSRNEALAISMQLLTEGKGEKILAERARAKAVLG
jgi:hypothetical protein